MKEIEINKNYNYEFAEYNGKIEMELFLDKLDIGDRSKVIAYIEKLVELLNINPFPNTKLSKHLKGGIFELRIKLKNKTARSFYFFEQNKMLIFTHSYIKKTDKIPLEEIIKADNIREYWRMKNE